LAVTMNSNRHLAGNAGAVHFKRIGKARAGSGQTGFWSRSLTS
jgi:hypothetical protein